MIKRIFLAGLFFIGLQTGFACTNFLAGKNATVDGSTLITYSADSYYLYGALYHYPAATYPAGAMLDVYEWDTGLYKGQIKQVPQTYSVIGNMNEHQLSIAETTFVGREELIDTTGIIDYGSLIYITLQRARTAREAIRIMTDLVTEYGYCSAGESFSIADPNEVWIMEMSGKGPGNKGVVWVAMRIPDDCVSGHANQARITTFPLRDKDNCLYSRDVISFARSQGYFSGKDKDFDFAEAYNPLDYSGIRFCDARVWSMFRQVDPEMDKYISYIKGETKERMPLWVKPVGKVSVDDFKAFMRDQYEGTELDITQGIAAGPFHSKLKLSPLTFMVDGVEYCQERPVATQQTGFTFVAQMRGWLPDYIGGILWFGVDDAATALYVPMYCGITDIPKCYSELNGSLYDFSITSAFWVYNMVANFAYSRYSMMMPDIRQVQRQWEDTFKSLVPSIDEAAAALPEDQARRLLTSFSCTQAEESTAAWRKLGEYLLIKHLDGVVKKEKDGHFLYTEKKIPEEILRPGYPEEFLRKMVEENPSIRMRTRTEMNNRK